MEEKQKKQRTGNGIILLFLLAVTVVIYLPGMKNLGYYRDDWNNVYNAFTQGADMLIRHYASDRPVDGYLLSWAYSLFGADPYPYLLVNLACRFLSALCFFFTLRIIWPRQRTAAFCAALCFLVFPGFLRQVDGIAYLPHQIAMLCIALSLLLSILSLKVRRILPKILLAVASVALAVAEMFLMEYYIGLEAFRFFLIGFYLYNHTQAKKAGLIGKTLIAFLPWLVGAAFFFYWRSFLFEASRNGTDVQAVLTPLFQHPKYMGLSLLAKIIKNAAKITFGAWTVPVYNVLNSLDVKAFWPAAAVGAVVGSLFALVFFRQLGSEPGDPDPESGEVEASAPRRIPWQIQWILLGAVSVVLTITPMLLAEREITFSSSLDRFSYPGSLSAVLFLIGLIGLISCRWIKTLLLALMITAACMTQIVNREKHITQTRLTNDFWWQLSWRAPDIAEYSLVVANPGGFSPEEDYEIFAPVHLIYYPERDHTAVGSEVLNTGTIRNAQMGIVTDRTIRQIYVWKDYNNLLALTKPTEKSCLQVIDGENPLYSSNEWSKITEIGAYSKPERILTDTEPHVPSAVFFGEEPEHGWCYYYEKMALAQQKESWAELESIADAALAKGVYAEDRVEWIPLVMGFALAGRIDDARPYGEILKTDDYLHFQACAYFTKAAEKISSPVPSPEGLEWLTKEFCE